MRKAFSLDSEFMLFMEHVANLIVLNCLFLLACVPLITIGPAMSALYTMVFRIGTLKEKAIGKAFIQAFRENFKQGLFLWLILAAFLAASVLNIWLFLGQTGRLFYMFLPFLILSLMILLVSGCVFPLQSQFQNSIKGTLKNAAVISIGYFPRFAVVLFLNILPIALLLLYPQVLINLTLLFLLIYFSLTAYINRLIMQGVFVALRDKANHE